MASLLRDGGGRFKGGARPFGEASVRGLDGLGAGLRSLPERYLQALAYALVREAETRMTEIKAEFVPVDTGNLRATGHVDPPIFSPNKVVVRFGFGGPAASYAPFVHENIGVFGDSPGGGSRADFDNPRRFRGRGKSKRERTFVGQSHYLQVPFERSLPGLRARLRAYVKQRFGKTR